MLDLLYLLSLMSLRAEDFVRDSEEFPTTSAPDTFPSITSRGPVPKASQTGWHPKHRYCANQYVHVGNPSGETTLTLRCLISSVVKHSPSSSNPQNHS